MNDEMLELIYAKACESDMIKHNVAYNRANNKNEDVYDELKKTLKGEELKLFEKFVDTYMDVECEACELYFKSGLKFGARIVFDLLYGN